MSRYCQRCNKKFGIFDGYIFEKEDGDLNVCYQCYEELYYEKIRKNQYNNINGNKIGNNNNELDKSRFERLLNELKIVNNQMRDLTNKLSDGRLSSEAYTTAMRTLETNKKEIEEELWRLRNKLYKDDYEKPF